MHHYYRILDCTLVASRMWFRRRYCNRCAKLGIPHLRCESMCDGESIDVNNWESSQWFPKCQCQAAATEVVVSWYVFGRNRAQPATCCMLHVLILRLSRFFAFLSSDAWLSNEQRSGALNPSGVESRSLQWGISMRCNIYMNMYWDFGDNFHDSIQDVLENSKLDTPWELPQRSLLLDWLPRSFRYLETHLKQICELPCFTCVQCGTKKRVSSCKPLRCNPNEVDIHHPAGPRWHCQHHLSQTWSKLQPQKTMTENTQKFANHKP